MDELNYYKEKINELQNKIKEMELNLIKIDDRINYLEEEFNELHDINHSNSNAFTVINDYNI
jgi:prefoldin subunit 5